METRNELDNTNVVTPSNSMESIKNDLSSISNATSDSITSSIQDNIPTSTQNTGTKGSMFKYVAIIIILAFLGVNIFSYLGNVTTVIIDLFRPVLSFFGYAVGDTIKQTTNVAAEGVKAATDITAKSVDTGVDVIQGALSNDNENIEDDDENIDDTDSIDQNEKIKQLDGAEKALNETIHTLNQKELENVPSPIETTSVGQSPSVHKGGFCLIGEVNGTRTCLKVGETETCMSNKIYPSLEICRDPNLRE